MKRYKKMKLKLVVLSKKIVRYKRNNNKLLCNLYMFKREYHVNKIKRSLLYDLKYGYDFDEFYNVFSLLDNFSNSTGKKYKYISDLFINNKNNLIKVKILDKQYSSNDVSTYYIYTFKKDSIPSYDIELNHTDKDQKNERKRFYDYYMGSTVHKRLYDAISMELDYMINMEINVLEGIFNILKL